MTNEDQELVRAALQRRLVTAEEVEVCRRAQQEAVSRGEDKPLSQLLVEHRFITPSQLERLLNEEPSLAPEVGPIPGYKILGKIGQGAMGAVFKARQLSVDRIVAIKVLSPRLSKKTEFVQRMMREARAAAKLNHPNIIQVFDILEERGYHFLAMEYVEGDSLAARLDREGRLSLADALHSVKTPHRAAYAPRAPWG